MTGDGSRSMLKLVKRSTSKSARPSPTPSVSIGRRWGLRAEVRCSFCLMSNSAGRRMVGGPGEAPNQVFICDECVALCAEILAETDESSLRDDSDIEPGE